MSFRLTPPQIQFLDQYGNPLTGGQLFFYQTNSANLAETFADSALQVPNPNPIVLDASGSCPAPFLAQGQLYKVVLTDQNGVVVYTVDPVSDPTSTGASVTSHFAITDQAGTQRSLFLQTAGLNRFALALTAVNESGSNAGSDLQIISYNDDGSPNDVVMTIDRSSGVADFANQPTVNGGSIVAGFTGMVAGFPAATAPAGWLACDGTLKSRTTYPDLWNFANASGNIITDANWTKSGATSQGAFSMGNGTTTFRLPDFRGYFLRGWANTETTIDKGRTIGSSQTDAIVDHAHAFFKTNVDNVNATGTGQNVNEGGGNAGTGSPIAPASGVTPNVDTETRPINIAILYCIKT